MPHATAPVGDCLFGDDLYNLNGQTRTCLDTMKYVLTSGFSASAFCTNAATACCETCKSKIDTKLCLKININLIKYYLSMGEYKKLLKQV